MNTPASALASELGIGEDEAIGVAGITAALAGAIGAMVGDRYGRPKLGAAIGLAVTVAIEIVLVYRADARALPVPADAPPATPPAAFQPPPGGFNLAGVKLAPRGSGELTAVGNAPNGLAGRS